VLDFARKVVVQGIYRLETQDKEIRKDLVAKNTKLEPGEIHTLSFTSQEEEYAYVGTEIKKLLDKDVEAEEIAVIAREHKQLTTLLPYLDSNRIPYTYTRKENVFDETHVKELITLCRFLATVGDATLTRDEFLPEILAFPFWGLNRIAVWKIAEYARRNNVSWLTAMAEGDDESIRELARFFIELGVLATTTPLEIILDTLIGSKDMPLAGEDEQDDFFTASSLRLTTTFVSPYKSYYFGENALKQTPSSYIHFLSSLRVFMRALREWKQGEVLKCSHVGDFVDMHTSYNIPLINETPFAHNENSVQLLTSHGAKGLEFSYVFIISVNDSIWAGSKKGSKLAFPANLPLASAGDTEDDFIRLFYVALTRARHSIYLTHHDSLFRFLQGEHQADGVITEIESGPVTHQRELLTEGLSVYHAPPFAHDETALLKKVVEGYMLSPTHFNNFLDITQGGPIKFLEQNILRFPQAKTVSSVYGTAIHKALEEGHVSASMTKKAPTLDSLVKAFRRELRRGRLLSFEEEKYGERGEKVLEKYHALNKKSFLVHSIVECNFAKQEVHVEGAHITGKIDQMIKLPDGGLRVIDFKTGKGFSSFDEGKLSVYEEIKLHHYRYQLMMYKILVENSRDYADTKVEEGVLEFVEEEVDGSIEKITITFDESMREELKRCRELMSIIYKKIISLDFPETEKYPKTLEGIKAFEEDLLKGAI
jgi:DNA helicase-2/ATP-dependent DNA helicase PcrA